MKSPLFCFLIIFAAVLHPSLAASELHKYVDSDGRQHYVDSLEKVPEQYREQLKNAPTIPTISKVTPGRDKLYEKEHYEPSVPAADGSLEIFVAEWCGYCRALEAELKKERIAFQRFDIESSAKGKKVYKELGGGGVPISRINGKTIVRGYNMPKIKKALGSR